MNAGRPSEKILHLLSGLAPRFGLRPPRFLAGDFGVVMMSALPYGGGGEDAPDPDNPVGVLAPFARKNFYREMTLRLRALAASAGEGPGETPGEARRRARVEALPAHRIFCNSPLPEKELAVASGLGRAGKNSLVYLPGEGSLFVLGGIFFPSPERSLSPGTGPPFRPVPLPEPGEICGACDACIRACPTGAIRGPGLVLRERCIQGLAADPVRVPEDIRETWGPTLYGCQICQEVCPLNRHPPMAADTGLGVLGAGVPLAAVLEAPEGRLKKTLFRGTVLDRSWISEAALRRNALFAAAHRGSRALLPLVSLYAQGSNPMLREAARWAAARIMAWTITGTGS